MNLPRRLLALSLLAACGPASAQLLGDKPLSFDRPAGQGLAGYVNGFFVLDNRLVYDLDNAAATRVRYAETSNLRGGGVNARLDLVPGVFLTGEYRRTRFTRVELFSRNTGQDVGRGIDSDLTTVRGGAGVGAAVYGVPVYVRGEYSGLELTGNTRSDGFQHGFGVLAGVSAPLNRVVGVEGEAGYTDNRDFGRGFEYHAGGWLNLLPNLALTLNYRRTRLQNGNVAGRGYLETGDAGIRFQFGGTGLPIP